MATVRVDEPYAEHDETIDAKGNVIEVEIPYLVFGVADETAALAAARPNVKTITGMTLESIEVMERINGDTWKVKAIYEVDEDGETPDDTGEEEDTTVFAFDTGGGTKHLNQSLKTDGRYPNTAPDFAGAIEVDNEGNVNMRRAVGVG